MPLRIPTSLLILTILVAGGCAKPPSEKLEAAEQAVKEAQQSGANLYAPEEYAKLEGTLAAMKQEAAEQEEKFPLFKDYGKAEQLAASTTTDAARITTEASRRKKRRKLLPFKLSRSRKKQCRPLWSSSRKLQWGRTVLPLKRFAMMPKPSRRL